MEKPGTQKRCAALSLESDVPVVREKDPKRWQEVLIKSPFATLTKQEVHDYYRTPEVQQAILDAVGKREAVVRQSFSPYEVVLRRKDEKGRFIHLNPKRLEGWNQKRLTEVHPTFGKKVDTLLVDIDPKKGVPWEKTRQIAETAAKALRSHDNVRDVSLQFSGNRGFYVRGHLDERIGVDRARNLTKRILGNLAQRPDVSLGTKGQIRLDTTPLKVRGSVRAPFSLDARTGLVAAPVKLEDLGKVKKKDFTIDKIVRKLRKKQAQLASPPVVPVTPPVKELFTEEQKAELREKVPNIVAALMDLRHLAKLGEATVGGDVRDDTTASRVNWDDPLVEDSKGSNTLPTGLRYIGPDRWNSLESIQSGINRKAPIGQQETDFEEHTLGLPKGTLERTVPAVRVDATKAAAEFAPGIPKSRKIHKLPQIGRPQTGWMMAVQEHKAKRAGKHYDLRLVGPKSTKAHSWALPKGRLPTKKDKMLLAMQQATHTKNYALNFTGEIPEGYGAGTVTMPIKEKVKMLKMTPDRVKFQRPSGEVFNMFRTKDNKWGIKQATMPPPAPRLTMPRRIMVGGPKPVEETPWYLDPNLLKLLTVAGASQFLKEKLLDSSENMD